MPERLPSAFYDDLAAGRLSQAVELLRRSAEREARRDPAAADAWLQTLRSEIEPELPGGFAWAEGIAASFAGEAERANRCLDRAGSLLDDELGPGGGDRARLLQLDSLGELGRLDQAQGLAERLIADFEAKGNHRRATVARANLAGVWDLNDRLDRAVPMWQEARRGFTDGSIESLLIGANLANAATLAGRVDEARDDLSQLLAQAESRGLEALADHVRLALAEADVAAGRLGAAIAAFESLSRSGGDGFSAVVARLDLAQLELGLGRASSALETLAGLEERLDELGLRQRRGELLRLRSAAELILGGQLEAGALGLLGGEERLIDPWLIDLAAAGISLPAAAVRAAGHRLRRRGLERRGLTGLAAAAKLELASGRAESARRLARRVLAADANLFARSIAHHVLARCSSQPSTIKSHLEAAFAALSDSATRLAATGDRFGLIELRSELVFDLLDSLIDSSSASDRQRALDVVAALEAMLREEIIDDAGEPSGDEELERWRDLRASLRQRLAQLDGDEEPRLRSLGAPALDSIHELDYELRSLRTRLARRRPILEDAEAAVSRASALPSLLRSGETFLQLLLGPDDLLALVVRADGVHSHRRVGVAPKIRSALHEVGFHLDLASRLDHSLLEAQSPSLEHRLDLVGELVLEALDGEFPLRLWIAGGGELARLPLSALRQGGRFVIEHSYIAGVPGPASLARLLAQAHPRPQSVVLGGSKTLPAVADELDALARIWPSSQVLEKLDRESVLHALQSADMLHLAGHALVLDSAPLASGLRLDDDWLTAFDLASIEAKARLLSIGVCCGSRRHGRGQLASEALMGCLMQAGVATLIGPMSVVEDRQAARFDLELHAALRDFGDPGRAHAEILRQRIHAGEPTATWAVFQIHGQIRPWEGRCT